MRVTGNNSKRNLPEIGVKALAAIAGFLLLLGCAAQAPVQQLSDARQAVAAAEDFGAKEYYPELLDEANMRLESAEKGMRQGIYWMAERDAEAAKDYAIDALLSTRRQIEQQNSADQTAGDAAADAEPESAAPAEQE